MNVKKKLIAGALSAVMGLSLIGGGTYAAFNDIEQIEEKIAAGTLDLSVNPTVVFNIDNLKPGDKIRRNFEIKNVGSLDIEKVLMHTSYKVYNKQGILVDSEYTRKFADQFLVTFLTTDGSALGDGLDKTLAEIKEMTDAKNSVDITSYIKIISNENDLPVGDTDNIIMEVMFKNDTNRFSNTDRKFKQNIYQGYKMDLKFDLEATQYKNGVVQPVKK